MSYVGHMAPHTYREYDEAIELAYHLHYDHGVSWPQVSALAMSGLVAMHRQAHS